MIHLLRFVLLTTLGLAVLYLIKAFTSADWYWLHDVFEWREFDRWGLVFTVLSVCAFAAPFVGLWHESTKPPSKGPYI